MLARFPEKLGKEVTGPVYDLRTLIKSSDSIDVAAHVKELAYTFKGTEGALDPGEDIESTDPGGFVSCINGLGVADLTGVGHLPVPDADDSGEKKLVSRNTVGEVISTGSGRLGKAESKGGELVFNRFHTAKGGLSEGFVKQDLERVRKTFPGGMESA